MVRCITSVPADTVGRRLSGVPVPTIWTSAPAGSIRRPRRTVRTVFSCVASRNSAARHTKAGVFSAKTFSPEWPIRHLTGAVVVPSGTPGLPRRGVQQGIRSVVARRQRRVLLVVVGSFREWQCPLLKFHHRRARSAVPHHPCGRLSVALPPGRESSTGPGLPRRYEYPRFRWIACRRRQRVQLVVVHCGYQCPQLGLRLQLAQSAEQLRPCERFSVALPPGTPKGCFTGVLSA